MIDHRTRLAVLGSPIEHSRSPQLHAAAYGVLDLPWQYSAIELTSSELSGFVDSRNETWRGLSLTMPLKRGILPLLDNVDDVVRLTGAANTVLFSAAGRLGFNTDVYGITRALRDGGVERVTNAHVIGGGATAASAIVAIADLGAERVTVFTRTPGRASALVELAGKRGVEIIIAELSDRSLPLPLPLPPPLRPALDLVVSTLPAGAGVEVPYSRAARAGATLLDVAYDPWPSPLAELWAEAGGRVVSGLDMLVHQAIAQIRVFVGGTPDRALEDETVVERAMRTSVGLPAPRA